MVYPKERNQDLELLQIVYGKVRKSLADISVIFPEDCTVEMRCSLLYQLNFCKH